MHITTRVFLLRMIDGLVLVAHQRPIATGRVRVELTTGLHRDVGGLLYRLDREILDGMHNDCPLATDPGNDGRPVFVVMAPTGLAFLAATTRSAPQRFLPALRRLALVPRRVIELIRFDRPLQLALH